MAILICGYSEQDWLAKHRLMLQALIAGSGLLSRDADFVARNKQESIQPGKNSLAGMQCTSVLSDDCRPTSSAPHALPHRTEGESFQYTVRGQSPSKGLVQPDDSTATTASAMLLAQPHEIAQSLMRKEEMVPNVPAHTCKKGWFERQMQPTDSEVHTFGTPDKNMLQTSAWQALVALSDSHDRSAGSRWTKIPIWRLLPPLHVNHILHDAAAQECFCSLLCPALSAIVGTAVIISVNIGFAGAHMKRKLP